MQGLGALQEGFIHLQSEHLGKEVGAQIADDDVEGDASAQHQPNHAANTNRDRLGGPHSILSAGRSRTALLHSIPTKQPPENLHPHQTLGDAALPTTHAGV